MHSILLLVSLVFTQGTGNGTTTGTAPNNTTCNPFLAECIEYTNGEQECELPATAARVNINSPNNTAYYYINTPINITISFSKETNKDYPLTGTSMFYRQIGQEQWNFWGNIPKQSNTIFRTLDNVIPGNYEVYQSLYRTLKTKLGPRTSCTPDGWPYYSPQNFRILPSKTVQPYDDRNGPNTNSGVMNSFSVLGLLALL